MDALKKISRDGLRGEVGALVERMVVDENLPLTLAERDRVVEEILDEVFGLGPLEPLLKDPTISDILVNGPQQVYVERAGKLVETNVRFADNRHLMHIIEKIVSSVGRRIDESTPLVDARLADGSRVNAIIPPLAIDGPSVSIRRPASTCPVRRSEGRGRIRCQPSTRRRSGSTSRTPTSSADARRSV